jgi:hypothetical protein
MRTVLAGVLLSMLAAGAGCGQANAESQAVIGYDFGKIDKIAIVDVTGRVYNEAAKDRISDLFAMKLMEKGYTFIERKNIKALLKEQEFQASDLASKDNVARAGQILNVPAIMMISIPKYSGGKMDVTAKIVDVETGAVLWQGMGSGDTGKALSTFVGAVAGVAAGAAIGNVASGGHSSTSTVLGGVGGGIVGGVAGNALAPQEEEVLNKVITKMIEKLPARVPQLK